jgi:hypothetical protein
MIEHGFMRTSMITRLRRRLLGAHLEARATRPCISRSIPPDSIRRTLRAGEQFGQWLAQHGQAIADVDEVLVARYIQTLPRPRVDRWRTVKIFEHTFLPQHIYGICKNP